MMIIAQFISSVLPAHKPERKTSSPELKILLLVFIQLTRKLNLNSCNLTCSPTCSHKICGLLPFRIISNQLCEIERTNLITCGLSKRFCDMHWLNLEHRLRDGYYNVLYFPPVYRIKRHVINISYPRSNSTPSK